MNSNKFIEERSLLKKEVEDLMKSKSNLINAIYYDTDWWNKKWALEWWNKSGHFNEDLYRNILLAKLDSINALQSTNK